MLSHERDCVSLPLLLAHPSLPVSFGLRRDRGGVSKLFRRRAKSDDVERDSKRAAVSTSVRLSISTFCVPTTGSIWAENKLVLQITKYKLNLKWPDWGVLLVSLKHYAAAHETENPGHSTLYTWNQPPQAPGNASVEAINETIAVEHNNIEGAGPHDVCEAGCHRFCHWLIAGWGYDLLS